MLTELRAVLASPLGFQKGYRIWHVMDVSLTTSGIAPGLMITMWRKRKSGGRRRSWKGQKDSQELGRTHMVKFGNTHLRHFSKSQSANDHFFFCLTPHSAVTVNALRFHPLHHSLRGSCFTNTTLIYVIFVSSAALSHHLSHAHLLKCVLDPDLRSGKPTAVIIRLAPQCQGGSAE